jgi:hypothetical protein
MELFLPRLVSVGPKHEVTISGAVVIHARFRQGANPYFDIPMPKLMKEWQKEWFYVRNDADVLLPTLIGNHPVS